MTDLRGGRQGEEAHVDPPVLLKVLRIDRIDPGGGDGFLHDRRIGDHQIELGHPMLALQLFHTLKPNRHQQPEGTTGRRTDLLCVTGRSVNLHDDRLAPFGRLDIRYGGRSADGEDDGVVRSEGVSLGETQADASRSSVLRGTGVEGWTDPRLAPEMSTVVILLESGGLAVSWDGLDRKY